MNNAQKHNGAIALAVLVIVMACIFALASCPSPAGSDSGSMVSLSYSANGKTVEVPDSQSTMSGGTVIVAMLQGFRPELAGFGFNGWNTKADGSGDSYGPGSTLKLNSDTVLYADWIDAGDDVYPLKLEIWPIDGLIDQTASQNIAIPEWLSDRRYTNGQSYSISITCTSDMPLVALYVYLYDASTGIEPDMNKRVSGLKNVTPVYNPVTKEYSFSGAVSLSAEKTSANDSEMANCLQFLAITTGTATPAPTITFTELSVWRNEPITLVSVTGNGSTGNATSELYLKFSAPVTLKYWTNVIITGQPSLYDIIMRQPLDSALTGFGTDWTLAVGCSNTTTNSFTIQVDVVQPGLTITGGPKTITFYTGQNITPPTPTINFERCTANGSDAAQTTKLDLYFDRAFSSGTLKASNITLSGISPITKGALTGPYPYTDTYGNESVYYTLNISGFSQGGNLTVDVAVPGYNVYKMNASGPSHKPLIYADYSSITYDGFVGRGYHVLASPYYVGSEVKTLPAINMQKIIGNGKYKEDTETVTQAIAKSITGETLEKHQREMSARAGASGGIGLFSASISVNYKTSTKTSAYRSFSTLNSEIIKKTEYLLINDPYLIRDQYLMPDFKAALANPGISPETLFDMYGTHIMAKAYRGGRLDMSYSYENTSRESNQEIDVKVQARYGFVKGEASYDEQTLDEAFGSATTEVIAIYGGNVGGPTNSMAGAKAHYPAWSSSIQAGTNLNLVRGGDIDNYWEMIPLWYLCENTTAGQQRAWALENKYDSLYRDKATWIKGLQDAPVEYIKDIYISKPCNSLDFAVNDCYAKAPNMTVIKTDLDKGASKFYIVMGYTMANNANSAITNIIILTMRPEDYEENLVRNGITYTGVNMRLNNASIWEYDYHNLFLYYTKDSRAGTPIKDLYLAMDGKITDIEGQSNWYPVKNSAAGTLENYGDANLNNLTPGNYIGLWMRR